MAIWLAFEQTNKPTYQYPALALSARPINNVMPWCVTAWRLAMMMANAIPLIDYDFCCLFRLLIELSDFMPDNDFTFTGAWTWWLNCFWHSFGRCWSAVISRSSGDCVPPTTVYWWWWWRWWWIITDDDDDNVWSSYGNNSNRKEHYEEKYPTVKMDDWVDVEWFTRFSI